MATEETASSIAKALGETDELPLAQITGVIRALGEDVSQKLLEETLATENKGGMMLPDGSRKRTPGGVFFFLARQKLAPADKLAIFRPPKEPKAPGSTPPEANKFPRRRVIEVAPSRPPPPVRSPRPGFVPPELPLAVRKVKAREHTLAALAGLPPDEQYAVLVDLLAELHDKLGYRSPDSQRPPAFDPPTRPAAVVASPPSSQRPIPVPESSRLTAGEGSRERGADSERPRRAGGRAKRN